MLFPKVKEKCANAIIMVNLNFLVWKLLDIVKQFYKKICEYWLKNVQNVFEINLKWNL